MSLWRCVAAITWVSLLVFFVDHYAHTSLFAAMIVGFWASAPLMAVSLYADTVTKAAASVHYEQGSRIGAIRRSRLLSSVLVVLLCLVLGWILVFWVAAHSDYGRYLIFTMPIVYLACQRKLRIWLTGEYRDYLRDLKAQRAAIFASAMLLALADLILLLTGWVEGDNSLSAALAQNIRQPLTDEASPLVALSARVYAYMFLAKQTLGAYLAVQIGAHEGLLLIAFVFMQVISATLLVSGVAAFFVPALEYRRLLMPLASARGAGPKLTSVVTGSAIGVLLVALLWPRLIVAVDQYLAQSQLLAPVAKVEQAALPSAYLIEGRACPERVVREINAAAVAMAQDSRLAREELRELVSAAYGHTEMNVSAYLDHYYSLPAEYLRLASALTGTLEATISEELEEFLLRDDPFGGLEYGLTNIVATDAQREAAYRNLVDSLLTRDCSDAALTRDRVVGNEYSLDQLLAPAQAVQLTNVRLRAGAGGVAGLSGVIAAKIVAKSVSRGAVSAAASAVTKVGAKKAITVASASGVGAMLGSVVPGAGTVVGAAAGAALGLLVGVSVDALLLELEEWYSRDEFEKQIVLSLQESKMETLESLGLLGAK